MSVSLPIVNDQWPLVRIYTAPSFALGVGPWTPSPMWSRNAAGMATAGLELLTCSRVALPAVGEATLRYRFGLIDGRMIGATSPASLAALVSGVPWDPATNDLSAPDLRGFEIRIQMAKAVAVGQTPAWRTEWWGQVEYQEDVGWPGAAYPAGERIYRCVDGFARSRRQPLDRHAVWIPTFDTPQLYPQGPSDSSAAQASTSFSIGCPGNPGYNVGPDGRTRGNRASTGDATGDYDPTGDRLSGVSVGKYHRHTTQGSAYSRSWTDLEVIQHAVCATRKAGEPIFTVAGATEWLSEGSSAWEAGEGESAFNLVCRIASRQRGRGLIYVDWADDTSDPTGPLSVYLTVAPQVVANVTYTPPGASVITLRGATSAGTAVAVDIIGDHRNLADSFQLGDADMARYDYVESYGEPIEALVTLSRYDVLSMETRWQSATATAFVALDAAKRSSDAWRAVYQSYGLPRAWRFLVGDHNGGAMNRCDYRCDDTGTVQAPGAGADYDCSPLLVEVLPDLPLFEGYDYTTSTPIPISGTGGIDPSIPARRPPFALIRTGANLYLTGDEITRPLDIHVQADGIYIAAREDGPNGQRVISDTLVASLVAAYDTSAIGVTVGIRLNNRVRMASYAAGKFSATAKRRLTVYHTGLHLWVGEPSAIWDLDASARAAARAPCAPRRACAGGSGVTPGILRDDRAALATLHSLACSWYLSARRTAQWGLRACGLLPAFDTGDGITAATQTYPRLGQLVTTLTASGQAFTINTPITSVSYDHQSGETRWATDWAELDFQ